MTDNRIEAATKEEWAARALRAEAKLAASYTRAQIEAAVNRALEAAADVAEVLDDPAPAIRALDPAQFVEGDKT